MNIEERIVINASRVAIVIIVSLVSLAAFDWFMYFSEELECQRWEENGYIHHEWQIKQCEHVGVL